MRCASFRLLHLSLLATFAALLASSPAIAAIYNVDTELDPLTADCSSGSAPCSLREAIRQSNLTPGTVDFIFLPEGHYQLQRVGRNEDSNETGDLDILDRVFIFGAGALETVIDARGLDRVFDIRHERSVIDAVTVTGGESVVGGAGIRVLFAGLGLTNSRVTGNRAGSGGGGVQLFLPADPSYVSDSLIGDNTGSPGGAELNTPGSGSTSAFDITRSSIVGNRCSAGFPDCTGGLLLTNCFGDELTKVLSSTIAENDGSGIESQGCDLEIQDSTIVDNNANRSDSSAGLRITDIGTREPLLQIYGSILANPRAPDCFFEGIVSGDKAFQGGNLDDDGSCGLDPLLDLPMTDPQLLPLGAFAALAPSYHPNRTSPVIDFNGSCLATDQDSFPRPQDPDGGDIGCDVGSIEVLECSIFVWNTIKSGMTFTSGEIKACESVIATDVTIDGNVTFSARYVILLGNGFRVLDGSSFVARLARDVGYVP